MTNPDEKKSWNSQGLSEQQSEQFSQDVQQIQSLKLFIRTLPKWCQDKQASVMIKIVSSPDMPGVGIEFGFDKKTLSLNDSNELTDRLIETNHLMELEQIIETMRGLNVPSEYINPLVDEANNLAKKLY